MGAGALTICQNKAAVQIKQDMKKMVQLPMLRGTSRGPRGVEARGGRLFGVSLLELRELGLVKDGVPLVVWSMVEFLREHVTPPTSPLSGYSPNLSFVWLLPQPLLCLVTPPTSPSYLLMRSNCLHLLIYSFHIPPLLPYSRHPCPLSSPFHCASLPLSPPAIISHPPHPSMISPLSLLSPSPALHHEGLFRVNGNVRAVEGLKQRLENGEDVDFLVEVDVCTVASLFKQYLRDLPEGLVDSTVQPALIKQHQESSEDGFCSDLRVLLRQLPDVHYSLLQYLCLFLTQVDQRHRENLMTALNLATVFGPNVFHVSSGFDGIQEQNICNKIMAKLIQNYSSIFNNNHQDDDHKEEHCVFNRDGDRGEYIQESPPSNIIIVKEAKETPVNRTDTESPKTLGTTPFTPTHTQKTPKKTAIPVPRKKKAASSSPPDDTKSSKELSNDNPIITPRKQKVRKVKHETATVLRAVPLPSLSPGLPYVRPLVLPVSLAPEVRSPRPERMELTPQEPQGPATDAWDVSAVKTTEVLNSSQEEDSRPISPFYISNHLSSVRCRSDLTNVLERTIRSAVEQHLFDVHMCGGGQSTTEDSEWTGCSSSPVVTPTARQRRRHQREQEEAQRHRDRSRSSSLGEGDINKENIPAAGSVSRTISCGVSVGEEGVWRDYQTSQRGLHHEGPRPRKPKHCHQSPTLGQLSDNQDPHALKECISRVHDEAGTNNMESSDNRNDSQRKDHSLLTPSWTRLSSMKIQELPSSCETADRRGVIGRSSDQECGEDVPRLDLSALTNDNNWGEPVPAYSSWQRESMDSEEACISPQVGGRLIRQLIEEDSDPMLSPRFHAYGHCQQYIDDTEVPPSPPNTHSFASRRRSSSLGSCGDDDQQELTSAQLSKKIHGLKRKIHKYEEKFEEERKYRPSHSDKADNPEVLKWMNELAKLRKDLKEHKLHKSEEDLPPLTRQRSNTLPKSFGSQLEKKPQQEKAPKPPVENTLEGVQNKLQEKRDEVGRPEDVKDMTRDQIGAEKVALQKALLYYEGIHGRPVTKTERQIMKPLYDRYRLVKQILCRASTIPVIEEEDGSEDDSESNNKPQITGTVRPDFSMLGFLDQLEEETDGFISPVDELSPSKNTTDMRLSNLHSATMPELVEQLQEAREEKKRIRKNLREFEDQFFRQNGRNVQKEDRSPLAVEYNEYKHIKAKLRLIEVLISKGDASKFT